MTDVTLNLASPSDWNSCEPFLLKALARTKNWSIDGVALSALRGEITLWKVEDGGKIIGAGALQVEQIQDSKRLTVVLFSGVGRWFESFKDLKQIARLWGCDTIYGEGRMGWIRKLGATPVVAWELPVGDFDDAQEIT